MEDEVCDAPSFTLEVESSHMIIPPIAPKPNTFEADNNHLTHHAVRFLFRSISTVRVSRAEFIPGMGLKRVTPLLQDLCQTYLMEVVVQAQDLDFERVR